MKVLSSEKWLLGIWILLGGILRFLNLGNKPIWTDEVATMVFSLGNDYESIPLNQVISLEQLLQPLQINPQATLVDVASNLITQDNHPPLYFLLAHLWLQVFPSANSYRSVWVARSLPAILGIVSIPLTYFLAKLSFRSSFVAQLAAGLMAFSPYGIFLAQEARHYTLGILLVILSLSCLIITVRILYQHQVIPWGLVYSWLLVNCLGLGIHYFFSLTLLAQSLLLIGLLIYQIKEQKISGKNWLRISWVLIGTLLTALVWIIKILPPDFGNGMTDWLEPSSLSFRALISPIFQLLAAWVTMISLLPIESSSLGIAIISGLLMIGFFIKLIPHLKTALYKSWLIPNHRLEIMTIGAFIGAAIIIFLLITYSSGKDITRGARYSFVYFPALMVLMALLLGNLWKYQQQPKIVIMVFLMAFLSGLTVANDLGYKKYYWTDKFLEVIQSNSNYPMLIATTHTTLVQAGEMMGLAWQIKQQDKSLKPQFLLVQQQEKDAPESTKILAESIMKRPKPLEIWTVNFQAPIDLKDCELSTESFPYISGYNYQKYICDRPRE